MVKGRVCLTFDVEEFTSFDDYCENSKYSNSTFFSAEGVTKLLKLLDKYDVKATFFVTGYFAENEPAIVKKIYSSGHEIASHSYRDEDHSKFDYSQTFKAISKSKQILGRLTCDKVSGFRMPGFSVNSYLSDVLKELDFKYDSSVHPAIVPGHYYNLFEKKDIYLFDGLSEIPLSVMPFFRCPISFLWMRILGNRFTSFGADLNLIMGRPVILYFHPWEFVKLPNINRVPWYITYNCGDKFFRQLEKFILRFKGCKFSKLVDLIKI